MPLLPRRGRRPPLSLSRRRAPPPSYRPPPRRLDNVASALTRPRKKEGRRTNRGRRGAPQRARPSPFVEDAARCAPLGREPERLPLFNGRGAAATGPTFPSQFREVGHDAPLVDARLVGVEEGRPPRSVVPRTSMLARSRLASFEAGKASDAAASIFLMVEGTSATLRRDDGPLEYVVLSLSCSDVGHLSSTLAPGPIPT